MRAPFLSLVAALASSAAAQHVAWYMQGQPYVVPSFARIGDLDDDGTDELLIWVMAPVGNPIQYSIGEIWAMSPATRSWWPVLTGAPYPGYEAPPVEHGDIDGDGLREFMIGATCYDGRTMQWLWYVNVPYGHPLWGYHKQGDIDINGDGRPDLVVTDGTDIEAYDHRGTLIYRRSSPDPSVFWGRSVGKFFDYDQDGCDDFLVGIDTPPTYEGGCELVSGRTGLPIFRLLGSNPYEELNGAVKMVGDFDRDGVPDIGIGVRSSFVPGAIEIHSTRTRQLIRRWQGTSVDGLGITFDGSLDMDQDGIPDLIAPKPFELATGGGVRSGTLNVYSGRDGSRIFYHQEWAVTNSQPGFYGAFPLPPTQGSVFPRFLSGLPNCCNVAQFQNDTRVYLVEGGPDGAQVLGPGCPGGLAVEPRIGLSAPTPTTARITVSDAPPGALTLLILGTTSLPTPVRLDPYGMPGCELLPQPIDIGVLLCGTTGLDAGYARHDFPRAFASPAQAGMTVVGQWAVIDPGQIWRAGMSKTLRWNFP